MDGKSPDIGPAPAPNIPTVTPRSWAAVEGTPLGTPVPQTGAQPETSGQGGMFSKFLGQFRQEEASMTPTAESTSIPAPAPPPDLESIAKGPQEGAGQNPLEWIAQKFEIGAPDSNEFIRNITEALARRRFEDSLANLTPNQQADVAALADGIAQVIRRTSGQAEDTTLKKNPMPEELKISFTKIIDDARRLGFLNQPDISFQEEKISDLPPIKHLDSATFTSENASLPAPEAVSAAEPTPPPAPAEDPMAAEASNALRASNQSTPGNPGTPGSSFR